MTGTIVVTRPSNDGDIRLGLIKVWNSDRFLLAQPPAGRQQAGDGFAGRVDRNDVRGLRGHFSHQPAVDQFDPPILEHTRIGHAFIFVDCDSVEIAQNVGLRRENIWVRSRQQGCWQSRHRQPVLRRRSESRDSETIIYSVAVAPRLQW